MAKTIKIQPLSGTNSKAPRAYEAPHAQLARRAATEGIVLLKNEDHVLPVADGSKIALFGAGASKTIKGGTGSGDVNERDSISIWQGLTDAGYKITTEDWIRDYDRQYADARQAWKLEILAEQKSLEAAGQMSSFFVAYSHHQFTLPAGGPVYSTDADIAVYVLSRVAGENADRFARGGDYYLSEEEHHMLADLCSIYDKTIVIVNAGGVVDLSFLDEFPAIKGVLVVSQLGMEGGHAVADVLHGDVNPSGKLTDTWALDYADYSNAATFSHNNGNVEKELYEEGIYVGYRYFDSFNVPARYGFGYGSSYTTFRVETKSIASAKDGTVTIQAAVTNTGSVAGKEVVQVYAVLPAGKLEKEVRRLVAFAKTRLLSPNETEEIMLRFGASQMESYDEEASAWVLESGTYGIFVGTSLDQSVLAATLMLPEDKTLEQLCSICPLQQELKQLCLSAEQCSIRYDELMAASAYVPAVAYDLSAVETRVVDYTLPEPEDEAAALVDSLSKDQLMHLATGDPSKGQDTALGNAGVSVPGSAAETSSCALQQGVANIVLADGPAGLRLTQSYYVADGQPISGPMEMNLEHGFFYEGEEPEGEKYYQYCTAIPVGTLLAQTWNLALLEEVGAMVGEEMEIFGVQLWLAPGMNIHRNPLCGRNFEYYAEDPLLSGKCAAAITRGVQSKLGIGATIKHYACNNQEDNRMGSDSILTERTLREIYLKGFEIAIKEAKPLSIMTSYNLINGIHAANNYDICTKVARCEFGFDGVIMTDWTTTNVDDNCTASGCIRAGNDIVMPGLPMDYDNLRKELEDGTLLLADLKRCITRLVRVVLRTNRYAESEL